MVKRLFLPLAPESAAPRPTVDAVRKRFGGRASTEAGAGEVVTLRAPQGERTGVVLFVRGDQLDVWLEGDVVRRVHRTDAPPADGVVPEEVLGVALDARAFGELYEGQRVYFQHEGVAGEGMLMEKCRFGGLVERSDGTIVGVAFRRFTHGLSIEETPRPPTSHR